jgi:heme exporter protein A
VQGLANLEADSLALTRGARVVLRDVSFSVRAGEALAVEGRNGAGKTSLLRAIAGFLEPVSGTLRLSVEGGDAFDTGEERGRFSGWLGHQDGLKLQFTALEHLSFFQRFYGRRGDAATTLARVGLARLKDMPAQYLSAGQRRRLALARLLVSERMLWLLDEPFAALDLDGKDLVRDLITGHAKGGGIVVAATHEPLGIACSTFQLA